MKLYTLYCHGEVIKRYTSLTRLKAYISDERECNELSCAMYIENGSGHVVKKYQSINN